MATKEQILQDCGKDIILLGKVISPKTYYLSTPEFHYELSSMLSDTSIRQGMAEAPRGSAKSSLCIDEVLRHLIYDKGDKVVVIQSKTRKEAVRRLTKIKNILDYSNEFRQLYGYFGEQVSKAWREDEIRVNTPYGSWTIAAIGTGQQARGILEDDTRITLYYLDDPDDEDNCLTSEQMDKNFDKFLGNMGGLDMRNGRVRVIGTPIRAGCIVERLRNTPGWTTLHYQAIDDKGEPLWPEMYSLEFLNTKKEEHKALGKLSKFYSEYMCQIVGDEDQLFRPEYIRYWSGEFFEEVGNSFLKVISLDKEKVDKIIPVNTFIGNDPASSTKNTADYSVRFTIGYDVDKNIYCLPYFRKRVTPIDFANEIIRAIKSDNPVRGHIESTGYQEMLRQYVRERLKEEKLTLPGLEVKFNPRTEKSARLEVLQPLFASRKVYLMENMPEFEDELFTYPRGKHDDLIDGFYYATRKLIQPHHTYGKPELNDDLKLIISRGRHITNNWKVA